MKKRIYYTLLINDGTPGDPWGVAFGDYDRDTIDDEVCDYRDHGFKNSQLKIIATGDRQSDIDDAVATLNAKTLRNA